MTFDEWFANWVKAAPEWNDAAGNYETIAAEAWEYQERKLAELREAAQAVVDNSEEHFDQEWLVEVDASYMKALKAFFAQAPEEGK